MKNKYSQPSIRGILIACSGLAVMLGIVFVYLLGTLTTWRNIALICLSIPIATVVAISFVNIKKLFSIEFLFIMEYGFRYLKHHFGCYQKIEKMMPKNLYNG